ncbi:MAG: hypothetical protein KF851_09480 [Pirellulaceae bacterium]|nr:hypothetical protein [Pirellulaceae bacterium]
MSRALQQLFTCLFFGLAANSMIADTLAAQGGGGILGGDSKNEPQDDASFAVVEGRVVDEQGSLVRGARVAARIQNRIMNFDEYLYYGFQFPEFDRELATSKSDREGKFRLPLSKKPLGDWTQIMALHDGFAPAVAWWNGQGDVEVKLDRGVSFSGGVLDEDGRPLSGARVSLIAWFNYEHNRQLLATNFPFVNCEGPLKGEFIRIDTLTDRQGQFKLQHVPKDRWIVLAVETDGFLPKSLVADTGKDPSLECPIISQLFFDGSSIRLQPATQLELLAVSSEDGISVPLETAYLALRGQLRANYPIIDRAKRIETRGNRVSLPALMPGMWRFWLVPKPDSGYIGAFVDLEPETGARQMKRRVELVCGVEVIGRVVDAVTDQPVPNVPIFYDPESAAELQELGAAVAGVKTDKNGEFKMYVPETDAHLRIIGRVEGYRSVSFDLNQDIRGIAPSQKISPKRSETTQVEFRLQPATRVFVNVVDTEGRPVPKARYAIRLSSGQRVGMSHSGFADDDGQIVLKDAFAEMFLEPPSEEDDPENDIRIPVLAIWSSDHQSNAVIRLPWPEEGDSQMSLLAVLAPAAEIEGQFVDVETGDGVSDVNFSPWYLSGPPVPKFSADSDETGRFVLSPAFPGMRVHFRISGQYVGEQRNLEREPVIISPGERRDVGKIPLVIYRDLEQLLEVPDVSQLEKEDALLELQTAFQKFRVRAEEIVRMQGGQRAEETLSSTQTTAAEQFGEAFIDLAYRSKDADFEFKVLVAYLSQIDQFFTHSFQVQRAKKDLIERFVDREEMVQLLPRIIGMFEHDRWRQVFTTTSNQRLKAMACHYAVGASSSRLTSPRVIAGLSDEKFEEILDEELKMWQAAIGELGDEEVMVGTKLRVRMTGELRKLVRQLETQPTGNRTRTERVIREIKQLLGEE